MKDTNKNLMILAIVVVVIVYFLFFKQKEGFTINPQGPEIIPDELLFYTLVFLPMRYGKEDVEVRKAFEWIKSMITEVPKDGIFSIHPNTEKDFTKKMEYLHKKYSQFFNNAGFFRGRDGIFKEFVLNGKEQDTVTFNCPPRSGFVMYGTNTKNPIRFNIPEGTKSLNINNISMKGDPQPGVVKKWDLKYVC